MSKSFERATLNPQNAPEFLKSWLDEYRPLIDHAIDDEIPAIINDDPGRIREAMRYAALGPGKRLRPAITLAAFEAVGGTTLARALPAAAAVEMLHAYTLVHDDLPAMDNDDERRGRPTVHIKYGEEIAILAGDALLTAAFKALSTLGPYASDAVLVLATRAGDQELIGGQARDITMDQSLFTASDIERIHAQKTGALFSAAAELGAIAAGAHPQQRSQLARFGLAIGIAFQFLDDRDDDELQNLRDYAQQRINEVSTEAIQLSTSLGRNGRKLLSLAEWISSKA